MRWFVLLGIVVVVGAGFGTRWELSWVLPIAGGVGLAVLFFALQERRLRVLQSWAAQTADVLPAACPSCGGDLQAFTKSKVRRGLERIGRAAAGVASVVAGTHAVVTGNEASDVAALVGLELADDRHNPRRLNAPFDALPCLAEPCGRNAWRDVSRARHGYQDAAILLVVFAATAAGIGALVTLSG